MPRGYTDGVGNKYVLQDTIGAYADEAYTDARRLSNSGIVSRNSTINTDQETFIGQMRWNQPLNPIINIASLVDPTDGVPTNYASDFLKYIKTVRTHGAYKVNLAEVVTKEDGLKVIARNFTNTRTTDENNAITSILKGVALSEAMRGAGTYNGEVGLGGQTFDNDPNDANYGFYVDLGADPLVGAAGTGAGRVQAFIEAIGMAFKDYEPEYAYLVTDPLLMSMFRSANLVDEDRITDGSIDFQSILGGKLRLVPSRNSMSFTPAERTKINTGAGIDIVGTRTSFVVLPGAIAMEPVAVPNPVGIDEDESSYHGGGSTDMWYRWGYVAHPAGYDWDGPDTKFPSDADYRSVYDPTDPTPIPVEVTDASVVAIDDVAPVWERKSSSVLSLGILPVFHG